MPGGPAAKSGLQQGDVIVRVNGQDVTPDETASYIIANSTVGSRVPIEIIRDGRRQVLQVQVGQRPTDEELALQSGGAGVEGEALGEETPRGAGHCARPFATDAQPANHPALNLPAATRGVVITSIAPGSDSAEKGLRRGDVILSVNRQAVTTPAQVLSAVDTARRAGRSSVLLLVKRGQAPETFVGD